MDLNKKIENKISQLSLQKVRPELDSRMDALFANAKSEESTSSKSKSKTGRGKMLPMLFAGFSGAAVAAAVMMIVMHYQILSVKSTMPVTQTHRVNTTPVTNDLDHNIRLEKTDPGYETTKLMHLGEQKAPVCATKKTRFKTVLIINPKKKLKFKVVVPQVEVKLVPVKQSSKE